MSFVDAGQTMDDGQWICEKLFNCEAKVEDGYSGRFSPPISR
jgi:hypothetical protein